VGVPLQPLAQGRHPVRHPATPQCAITGQRTVSEHPNEQQIKVGVWVSARCSTAAALSSQGDICSPPEQPSGPSAAKVTPGFLLHLLLFEGGAATLQLCVLGGAAAAPKKEKLTMLEKL
jgi:hypothetical protein